MLPVLVVSAGVAPDPRRDLAFGTGQVAEYGRLRWASIQPIK